MGNEEIIDSRFIRDWNGLRAKLNKKISNEIEIINCICDIRRFSRPNHMESCIKDSIYILSREHPELIISLNGNKYYEDGNGQIIFSLICIQL